MMKKIDNNIFYLLRIARNKTVKELAQVLRVTPAYINAIENGTRIPSTRLIKDYAEVLEVDEKIMLEFSEKDCKNTKFEEIMLLLLKKMLNK